MSWNRKQAVQRSSESVAALASALAKAQAELINPEKSLTATIANGRPGEGERTFRYAPLSSGLDIVRKTLGQHEIATMQTTAIDQASGLVNLTTVIAHASGEWIASDWPICPIAEMASPQRMGAALTYARRYALFTLVGIAGEDDLDAPDLTACGLPGSHELDLRQDRLASRESGNGRLRGARKSNPAVMFDAGQSAALRDKLLAEVTGLASAESAVAWAAGALAAKNSLIAVDAKVLEEAFEQKLSSLSSSALTEESAAALEVTEEPQAPGTGHHQPEGIDKSLLTIAAPRRYRNREHLRYVTQQTCLVCGARPSDSHHLGFMQPRASAARSAMSLRSHSAAGIIGRCIAARDERAWWKQADIDPIKIARRLWKQSHGVDRRQSHRSEVHRPHGATASSDPKNEGINATATAQEEARLPDLPG